MLKKMWSFFRLLKDGFWDNLNLGMKTKLIVIFLVVKVIPIILIAVLAWQQLGLLGTTLKEIAVNDSTKALNSSAVEKIERLTTDTSRQVAEFLYDRDDDIRYLSEMTPSKKSYRFFAENQKGRIIQSEKRVLDSDEGRWVLKDNDGEEEPKETEGVSTNAENNDEDGFHYRESDDFNYKDIPLYDEITYIDKSGMEKIKIVTKSTKKHYPMDSRKKDVSKKENTYVKAETYFEQLKNLKPGEIYVSDVIGAYVGSNYIGMYTPKVLKEAEEKLGYEIPYKPNKQAYAGQENPNGQRFEGIIRWAAPVTDQNNNITGYVTFALNHDHIMEFVDRITPMVDRYTDSPSAFEGNYAFIWDYNCRSICHPRHHSIVGFDPETGDEQIPWLETSIYEGWKNSGIEKWMDYIKDYPIFDAQSRTKKPAPELTKAGLVGLDGRYLNNAPQCTGWMDLTQNGGSGSFYILWSGIYKLTTAGAIPYYTGQYAPSAANDYSRRGFGFVAIGTGLEDFTGPARDTEQALSVAVRDSLQETSWKLIGITAVLIALVVLIAAWIASSLTNRIMKLILGVERFRTGERQFRFNSKVKDEFGTLADSFDDMADSIVDSVKNPLTITDMNLNIIYMNELGLKINKKTLKDIVGKSYNDHGVYLGDSRFCPVTALKQNKEAEVCYLQAVDKYYRGAANYLYNKAGEKTGYIIESIDVTDMVRRQMELSEQRALLNEIFSASPDLIWYKNAEGEYLAVNPRFASIAGCSTEDLVGKTGEDLLPAKYASGILGRDKKAIMSREPLYTEESIEFADGHTEILESVRTTIIDERGNVVGMLGFARNVTARVNIENELRSTQIELEKAVSDANKANKHKGDFLARMSHEIRTPMNAIIGITNIVLRRLEGVDSISDVKEIRSNINQIEVSSQHLLGLLNDILDISKIDAGKIELLDESMDLKKLFETVVNVIASRCNEKNIKFITEFESFKPNTFRSDPLRLRQVLINLLGNAVKFTPDCGTMEFRIKKLDRKDGRTLVEFVVKDTGIGISDESLKDIFKAFEQANKNTTSNYGGTGLGLAISSRIVELFGGVISVESKIGEGSTFKFSIWLREEETDEEADEFEVDVTGKFNGMRALLVDDVDINRMIVSSLLEITGIEIDEADDGSTALKIFKNSPVNTYDIILMDVKMPNMDGYEASKAIRSLDREDSSNIPIVALTANAFKDDIEKAMASGMTAHVAKPIEMEKLFEVMIKFLYRR